MHRQADLSGAGTEHLGLAPHVWSMNFSAIGAAACLRATAAPMEKPLPRHLAVTKMSGTIPSASNPEKSAPVRTKPGYLVGNEQPARSAHSAAPDRWRSRKCCSAVLHCLGAIGSKVRRPVNSGDSSRCSMLNGWISRRAAAPKMMQSRRFRCCERAQRKNPRYRLGSEPGFAAYDPEVGSIFTNDHAAKKTFKIQGVSPLRRWPVPSRP